MQMEQRQLDLFGYIKPDPAPTEKPDKPADYSILSYIGNVVCLSIQEHDVRDNLAEKKLMIQIRQLQKTELSGLVEYLKNWMNARHMGNASRYDYSYKLVPIDAQTVEVWHDLIGVGLDRHLCTITQFRPAVFADPFANW